LGDFYLDKRLYVRLHFKKLHSSVHLLMESTLPRQLSQIPHRLLNAHISISKHLLHLRFSHLRPRFLLSLVAYFLNTRIVVCLRQNHFRSTRQIILLVRTPMQRISR
jgi:hypothetical protein